MIRATYHPVGLRQPKAGRHTLRAARGRAARCDTSALEILHGLVDERVATRLQSLNDWLVTFTDEIRVLAGGRQRPDRADEHLL